MASLMGSFISDVIADTIFIRDRLTERFLGRTLHIQVPAEARVTVTHAEVRRRSLRTGNGLHERRIEILGIPMDLGQDRRGVDMGPSALRYARLQAALTELGHTVTDLGNIDVPIPEVAKPHDGGRHEMAHLQTIREVCERTMKTARAAATGGAFPVFLGGDHSISIGTVSGVAAAGRTGVLWVDAHADFNTPETSLSGNVHGMPLAVLTGGGDPDLVGIGGEEASVRAEDAVLLGLRSVDPVEQRLLAEASVRAYTMKEIDVHGMAGIVDRVLEHLSHLDRVHLSFDLDVMGPNLAPGVGTPVRGGLTYREAHLLMELVSDAGIITSLDVVEINPILDEKNATAELAVEVVASLLGRSILELPRPDRLS
jgi:arginase